MRKNIFTPMTTVPNDEVVYPLQNENTVVSLQGKNTVHPDVVPAYEVEAEFSTTSA